MSGDGRLPEAAVSFLIRDVARLLRRRFDDGAEESVLGLTRNQSFVLVYVAQEEGLSQAHLAHQLQIEPIALVRLLDRLEEAGLVERRLDPRDRRVWRLYLTPAAAPVLKRIRALNRAVGATALSKLLPAQQTALIDLLRHLRSNLTGEAAPDSGVAKMPAAALSR